MMGGLTYSVKEAGVSRGGYYGQWPERAVGEFRGCGALRDSFEDRDWSRSAMDRRGEGRERGFPHGEGTNGDGIFRSGGKDADRVPRGPVGEGSAGGGGAGRTEGVE